MDTITRMRVVLAASCLFLLIACKREVEGELPDCSNNTVSASTEVLAFNVDQESLHLGEDVAYFELEQTITRFNSRKCGDDVGSVMLTVRNATNSKITFNYTLIARSREKEEIWRYQSTLTSNPKISIKIGEISSSTHSIENESTSFRGLVENVIYQ